MVAVALGWTGGGGGVGAGGGVVLVPEPCLEVDADVVLLLPEAGCWAGVVLPPPLSGEVAPPLPEGSVGCAGLVGAAGPVGWPGSVVRSSGSGALPAGVPRGPPAVAASAGRMTAQQTAAAQPTAASMRTTRAGRPGMSNRVLKSSNPSQTPETSLTATRGGELIRTLARAPLQQDAGEGQTVVTV